MISLNNNHNDIYLQIYKSNDEYYYVQILNIYSYKSTIYTYHICDQLEGIKQLLIDKKII